MFNKTKSRRVLLAQPRLRFQQLIHRLQERPWKQPRAIAALRPWLALAWQQVWPRDFGGAADFGEVGAVESFNKERTWFVVAVLGNLSLI